MKSDPEATYTEELLRAGPLPFRAISWQEAKVKIVGLERWQWLWDALQTVPEAECLLLDIPEGHESTRVILCLRSAIKQAAKTQDSKWLVQATADGKSVVISRSEKAKEVKRRVAGNDDATPLISAPTRPSPSIAQVLRQAAGEAQRRTSIELTNRVQELLPQAQRASIQSTIWAEMGAGRLHKMSDLAIRPVIDGKAI